MFTQRTHPQFIELEPDQEILYRLPPMSNGRVVIEVRDAFFTNGPKGEVISHDGFASDLELELRHSDHLRVPGTNRIVAESEWHDDLWRLKVRRLRRNPDPAAPSIALRYRIDVTYTSQLPVIERRIPLSYFHDGFEANWNRQEYIQIRLVSNRIEISFEEDLRRLHDLEKTYAVDTGRLSFVDDAFMIKGSQRLDVGVGPPPLGGDDAVFFSIRVEFPAVEVKFDVPKFFDLDHKLPAFFFTVRLYLLAFGRGLVYHPTVESNLLDLLDFEVGIPDPGEIVRTVNLKQLIKKTIEDGLFKLQVTETSGSVFGDFLRPWLVGGSNELLSAGYARGAGDTRGPDGIAEPATGELIIRSVGPRAKPSTQPVLQDPAGAISPADDGSIRLFDLPDEEPDPVVGVGSGGGGKGPGTGGVSPGLVKPKPRPDIGALAKIENIVVLMQENRSFDQVLGYLSRDKVNLKVDGLLPPDDPDHLKQVNRFNNRNFFPQKADKGKPPGNPPRKSDTEWPRFTGASSNPVLGPCHDSKCVTFQMENNMGRFVADFAERTGATSAGGGINPNLQLVMDYFDGGQLRFFDLLAHEFGISDRWYTSHPGPTWPNRFIMMTGDLNRDSVGRVERDSPDLKVFIPIETPTLFDLLSERGVSWRIFEHGIGFSRVFKQLTFDTTNVVPFDDKERGFKKLAALGTLPQVTLIEPDYIDLPPGNDDHPPADMAHGQFLVEDIVKALIDSPQWNKTLLIITYDEHGGFYDHRPPPTLAPPLLDGGRTLGPRVPAFFISPLIKPESVFFGRGDEGRFFDHTSIGATILRRFAGGRSPVNVVHPPKVSPRLDAARDLREVLELAEPRPTSDFDSIRQFTRIPLPSETRTRQSRAERIGFPDSPQEDFHWLLSAVRLTTGEPPKVSRPRIRPSQKQSGELLYFRDTARNGTGDVSNPAVVGLGGWQDFTSFFSGGNGIIYTVEQTGKLLFYRDTTQDGTGDVSTPSVIGHGWQNFKFVFSGGNGIIYAIDPQGPLRFLRDTTLDGTGIVHNATVIGHGWQDFKFVFSGGDGIIYAVDVQGRLLFFRDTTRDGTGIVHNAAVIGQGGWQKFTGVFSGGNGIIYAVDNEGRLLFYRDTTQNGTGDVANPAVIGQGGWQNFKFLSSGGNGIIYAVVR